MSLHKSWALLSLGLLLITFGTLTLMLLLYYWEKSIQNKKLEDSSPQLLYMTPVTIKEDKVTSLGPITFNQTIESKELTDQGSSKESAKELNLLQTTLKEYQEKQNQLIQSLELKTQELHKLEGENQLAQLKAQQIAQDFADYKLFSEEQLRQKQLQLTVLQQMLEDQKYEIKTLLCLHEEENSPTKLPIPKVEESAPPCLTGTRLAMNQEQAYPIVNSQMEETITIENSIRTPVEAINLLKKCINIAQKLTGANYYSNESSRYREFSSSYYAIDQRRLFDSLRDEAGALILVYSQKENKLLFVNNQSKTLLGWSPEKFLIDFSMIIQGDLNDWKKNLSLLAPTSDSQTRLLAKTKQGQEILLNGHLGVIPTGLFRNHVIGVFYPA